MYIDYYKLKMLKKMVGKESSSSSEDEDIDFEELMVTKLALANTENQEKKEHKWC